MFLRTAYKILKRAILQWGENRGAEISAALAFYAVFSLAPLIVIAIAIAGFAFGEETTSQQIHTMLKEATSEDVAAWVMQVVSNLSKNTSGGVWATVIGIIVLFYGASKVFLYTRASFCEIWHITPQVSHGILRFLINYFWAIVMVLCVGLLLLASLIVGAATPWLWDLFREHMPAGEVMTRILEFIIAYVYITVLFAIVYWVLSGYKLKWLSVIYGSLIASLLFTIGKTVLALYLNYASPASVFGAAGSIVVFLIWIQYSSQVMLIGAEMIQARRTMSEWMDRK